MIDFRSSDDRKWHFRGVSSRVERIRDMTGIDLGLNYDTEGLKRFQQVIEDRSSALALICAAVEEQEDARKLTSDEWDELWPTELVIDALFAIGKEAARFFSPLQSKAATSSLNRLEIEYRRILQELETTISTADLPPTGADSSAEFSGSTPAS